MKKGNHVLLCRCCRHHCRRCRTVFCMRRSVSCYGKTSSLTVPNTLACMALLKLSSTVLESRHSRWNDASFWCFVLPSCVAEDVNKKEKDSAEDGAGSPLLRRAVHDGEAKLQMEMDRLAIDRQNANAWEWESKNRERETQAFQKITGNCDILVTTNATLSSSNANLAAALAGFQSPSPFHQHQPVGLEASVLAVIAETPARVPVMQERTPSQAPAPATARSMVPVTPCTVLLQFNAFVLTAWS